MPVGEGWQYRWGDSPIDARGVPLWAYNESDGSVWMPIDI
jgi:hypothetical protein